ncbi:MAG: CoA-binding protein [Ignavibacterium album]|uniref:CoA-binding protein n=1 Tax=Ignavibacterium album TaxID=591197 RepID=UPI0026EEC34A|nr:CoA-binding protein [Ignavibacterium album]MCX8105337.1 CoA-binding protein [Ignavibacterium album]
MNSKTLIDDFLSKKEVAVIGVSSKGKGFGVAVYNQLKKAGYNVFGVNKNGGLLNENMLYKSLNDLPQKVGAVITVIPPAETEKIIDEMIELSINHIWMQQGSESKKAIEKCNVYGIKVISGECILMYAEPVKSIHSFHSWINKIIGKYPN